jgi:hypothetical protein
LIRLVLEGVAGVLPPLAEAGVPRDGRGVLLVRGAAAGLTTDDVAGDRARERDDAVGLLNRSRAPPLTFFAGDGAGDGAPRARAREAAVGAYRFDGLGERVAVRTGVFGR